MRMRHLFAALVATALAVALAMPSAEAGFLRDRGHSGYGETRDVHHYVYRPHYRHHYHTPVGRDPYAYRYQYRGYYPYYGSRYWVPAYKMRYRYRYDYSHGPKYRYYPSWGRKKHGWKHRKWHYEHHGRHRRHHW